MSGGHVSVHASMRWLLTLCSISGYGQATNTRKGALERGRFQLDESQLVGQKSDRQTRVLLYRMSNRGCHRSVLGKCS